MENFLNECLTNYRRTNVRGMKMRKNVIAILTASMILASIFAPALFIKTAIAADPTDWYMTVNGVLNSDYYSLYPYSAKSLKIGFSKYGEMIDSNTNTGLEYGAVDPFAAPAGSAVGSIPKSMWLNGWLINITYYNIPQGKTRNVWATAQFADATAYGGSWIRVDFANDYSTTYGYEDPRDPGYIIGNYSAGGLNFGGRKTNGTAVTAPITVLYNGPRLFVALTNTTIYDHPTYLSDDTTADIPLARVLITIVFNKVKKEVVLLKDVKSLLTEKVGQFMHIQFSNRGEVDLGTEAAGYHSYFHFCTQGTGLYDNLVEGQGTVYGRSWTACPTDPAATQNSAHGNEPGSTYDVAQAINPIAGYVWWAAFWPSLSDWTIDGWSTGWWKSLTAADPHYIDAAGYIDPSLPKEPKIPYYIGEWDFTLYAKEFAATNPIQFRGVTVYGVTDRHDGSDDDMDGVHGEWSENVIDKEVYYQLDEVFNPWDLDDAVWKDTVRDVKFVSGPLSSGAVIWLGEPLVERTWDEYCSFAERVLLLPDGILWKRGTQYVLWDKDEDGAYDSIKLLISVASGKTLKILYSTKTYYATDGVLNFEFYAVNSTELSISAKYQNWTDPLGAFHKLGLDDMEIYVEILNRTSDFTATFVINKDWGWASDFKVFKESTTTISWDHDEKIMRENENASMTMWTDIHWYITPPYQKDLHVWYLEWGTNITVTISYNATTETCNITATVGLGYYYRETVPGRYEWGVVGRDAHSVDSAGLSMVSAAFKNKQVEYGLAGADMYDPLIAAQMPWVMHKFGTGNTWADYKDALGRSALRDDWCHAGTFEGDEVPVASSNMIGVGGCLANLLAYYGNDFMTAFFALGDFTGYAGWKNKIVPLTCWDVTKTRAFVSNETTGYAVISTYKDLNGTVLFLIWGHWGRDTYYISKWFHEEGIYQLQEAPEGLTAIIVKIDYESTSEGYKPTNFSIVECLGTISEIKWVHGDEIKGGIHDP
jgi:hypothetical protein